MKTKTIVDRDQVVAALEEEWDALVELAVDLRSDDWEHPTDLPGWSVKDCYAHIIGTESMLLGRKLPEVKLADELPHVHNELGRTNEIWVEWYRAKSGADVVADLAEVITERRGALANMDQAVFDKASWTPAGQDTYGRFMRIRVFDQWFHEQDVRAAIGRPGHLNGSAPERVLDELTTVVPIVVGRRAGLEPGTTVRIDLKGPMSHSWDIEVTDRARLVDGFANDPTVTLMMPGATFCRLVGGRRPWDHPWISSAIVTLGDHDVGKQVLSHLAFMI